MSVSSDIHYNKKSGIFIPLWDNIVHSSRLKFILPLLYFVLISIIGFAFHDFGTYGAETDFFCAYVPQAKEVMNGNIYIGEFKGPLYPMALSVFSFILSNAYFRAGILISILSACAVIFFTVEIFRRLFPADISFLAIFLMMANPIFIQYSYTAGTDMFFNGLIAGVAYFFLRDETLKWRNIAIAAILSALAYLTRYNAIFLLAAIPMGLIFINPFKLNWKRRLLATIVYLLLFLTIITPWGIYCLKEKGDFFYNHNLYNVAYEVYYKDAVSWDEFWYNLAPQFDSIFDVIFKDIRRFTKTIIINIYKHLKFDLETFFTLDIPILIFLPFLFFLFYRSDSRKFTYYIYNLCFFSLLLLVFYMPRFALFLIPFYSLVLANALKIFDLNINPIRKWRYKKHLTTGIAILLIIIRLGHAYHFNRKHISGPEEARAIVRWVKVNIPKSERGKSVAARIPHIAYFLKLEDKGLPYVRDYDNFISTLQELNVDYLYLSDREMAARKDLEYIQKLLKAEDFPEDLTLLTRFQNGYSAVLYEIR